MFFLPSWRRCVLFYFSDETDDRDRAYTNEEAQHAQDELLADKRFAKVRLEFNHLKEVRRDLESKIAKMQARNSRIQLKSNKLIKEVTVVAPLVHARP